MPTPDPSFLRRNAGIIVAVLVALLIVACFFAATLVVRGEPPVAPGRAEPVPSVLELTGVEADERMELAGFDRVVFVDETGNIVVPGEIAEVVGQYPRGGEPLPVDAPAFVIGQRHR